MSLTRALKQLRGNVDGVRDLDERDARELLSAMLDAGIGELDLGAALALLEQKTITLSELLGYSAALAQRCSHLRPPAGPARPVVFACSGAIRERRAAGGRRQSRNGLGIAARFPGGERPHGIAA